MNLRIIDYRATCVGQPTDGATKFGIELPFLLRNAGATLSLHGFESLLRAERALYACGAALFSAAGPYAFLYHYWRDRLGAGIPIVRDIHGGAWSGYLLQEWLCESLTRPGDVIVYPSEFARALYARLFPNNPAKRIVGHPMFGADTPPAQRRATKGTLKIGTIGRLSRDKNVLDLVGAVAALRGNLRRDDVELHVVGGAYDLSWHDVEQEWRAQGGDPARLVYWGYGLSDCAIEEFYRTISVLGFFSTSNIEALGRVVVEATHAGAPVCMAGHAAADELVPPEHQVDVAFFEHRSSCTTGVPLGAVDANAGAHAIERVIAGDRPPPIRNRRFLAGPFTDELERTLGGEPSAHVARSRFADSVCVDLPPALSSDQACAIIAELLPHLHHWSARTSEAALDDVLLASSEEPSRSEIFLHDAVRGNVNYADTTGYPYHLAQLLDFRPTACVRLS